MAIIIIMMKPMFVFGWRMHSLFVFAFFLYSSSGKMNLPLDVYIILVYLFDFFRQFDPYKYGSLVMMNYSVASTLAPYNVHHLLSAMDIRKFLTKKSDDASLASASSSNTPSTSAVEDPMVVNREVPPDSSEEADDAQQNEGKKPAKRARKEPIRKYCDTYLAYGFISVGTKELPLPQCLLCSATFKNSAMKPAHLLKHLNSVHKVEPDKSLAFFTVKKAEWKLRSKEMVEFSHTEMRAIKSSFVVAYKVAKEKKPFTIAESFFKPTMIEVLKIMLGDSAAEKVDAIPLSNDTISRRIVDMSHDVQKQLCQQLKNADFFCLQFDESTDIAGKAILTGFVRYPHEYQIIENIFCCCSLPERTTGEQIFFAVDEKMKELELK